MLCGKIIFDFLCLGLFTCSLCLYIQYKRLDDNSFEKAKLRKEITETMLHRQHLDGSIDAVGVFLFGPTKGSSILNSVRKPGLPLVDDWECLKSTVIQESALSVVNSCQNLLFS